MAGAFLRLLNEVSFIGSTVASPLFPIPKTPKRQENTTPKGERELFQYLCTENSKPQNSGVENVCVYVQFLYLYDGEGDRRGLNGGRRRGLNVGTGFKQGLSGVAQNYALVLTC